MESSNDQTPKSPEINQEINKFSPEQRKILEAYGHEIVKLTKKSIGDVLKKMPELNENWINDRPHLKEEESIDSEVAITINRALPGKKIKHKDLVLSIEDHAKTMNRFLKGTTAIMGSLADYLELEINLNEIGESLFSNGQFYIDTTTNLGSSRQTNYHADLGKGNKILEIGEHPDYGIKNLKAVPIVIPQPTSNDIIQAA